MKLLAKKIFNSNIFVFLRNNLNIKTKRFKLNNLKKSISVSDSFYWRTDNGFETVFRFTDILKNFYKINNSSVEIIFYDKSGEFIKKIKIKNLNRSNNEIRINKIFLNNIEDYGTFHIFHKSDHYFKENVIISNRCYTGFSKKKSLPSFVHGNTYSSSKNISENSPKYSKITNNKIFINSKYKLQNYFSDYDRTELFFSNPTNYKVKFFVNKNFYELKKNECKLIEINNIEMYTITSNCLFLRPIIFNYRKNYFDVLHG